MFEYAHVENGVVGQVERLREALPVDHPKILAGALLPVEDDAFDSATEVREGAPTSLIVDGNRVLRVYSTRAKTPEEIADMILAKRAEISAEFERLWQLPIEHTIAAGTYIWDADQNAVGNISGLLDVYREAATLGMTLADPRFWTTNNDERVEIYRAEIAGLGIAIAVRKDALFAIKKAKHAAVSALTDPAEIAAYDATTGWGLP